MPIFNKVITILEDLMCNQLDMYLKFNSLKLRAQTEVNYQNTMKILVKTNLVL